MTLLKDGLDKVLCRTRKSLIFSTLCEVSIIFGRESFIDAKNVLNFIVSLINGKKVIKLLTEFHRSETFKSKGNAQFIKKYDLWTLRKTMFCKIPVNARETSPLSYLPNLFTLNRYFILSGNQIYPPRWYIFLVWIFFNTHYSDKIDREDR